jgi:hypothetical protein
MLMQLFEGSDPELRAPYLYRQYLHCGGVLRAGPDVLFLSG